MTDPSESGVPAGDTGQSGAGNQGRPPTYDEIALRAYFIALDRAARGEPGNPERDWIEAERQLNPKTGLRSSEPRPWV